MVNTWSRIGEYHIEQGIDNQDAVVCGENEQYQVIAIADGISSCLKAKEGAEIATRYVKGLLLDKGWFFLESDPNTACKVLIKYISGKIKEESIKHGENENEYSCTLACALKEKESGKIIWMNIGDGLICKVIDGNISILAQPVDSINGCPSVLSDEQNICIKFGRDKLSDNESIYIFTDGAWDYISERGNIRGDIKKMLCSRDFVRLKEYFDKNRIFDDSSIGMMTA